ncbi:MAG: class I SAM-dependent rRNA methyltransferase, partial [Myxococcota bacterium]|nr:class I SAM-dependent rRNA methyltransferase [Myxococcota bacterium]
KDSMGRAIAAYRKLNRLGLSLLNPGGVMLTCSCSGRVTQVDFEKAVEHAARDLKCSIQILERRGAGVDHPVLMGMPETEYLKAIFVRKL